MKERFALLAAYFKEKLGYVPADSLPESVSWGVEMAYYDWCISQIAKKAGKKVWYDDTRCFINTMLYGFTFWLPMKLEIE